MPPVDRAVSDPAEPRRPYRRRRPARRQSREPEPPSAVGRFVHRPGGIRPVVRPLPHGAERRPRRARTSGAVVGVVNLNEIVGGVFQSAYLGYYGMAAFSRTGLMTEALRAAIGVAFGELGLHRLEANIQPGNHASIALVRRLGFTKEGFAALSAHRRRMARPRTVGAAGRRRALSAPLRPDTGRFSSRRRPLIADAPRRPASAARRPPDPAARSSRLHRLSQGRRDRCRHPLPDRERCGQERRRGERHRIALLQVRHHGRLRGLYGVRAVHRLLIARIPWKLPIKVAVFVPNWAAR